MSRSPTNNVANQHEAMTDAPFINEYKLKFLLKRLAKTLFGGLILTKINADLRVPWYVYPIQLILFVMPFVIGGIFILIRDLVNMSGWNLYIPIIAGVIYSTLIFILKFVSLMVINEVYKKRNSNKSSKVAKPTASSDSVTSNTLKLNKKRHQNRKYNQINFYNEEQDYEFTGFCSLSTFAFILPPVGIFYFKFLDDSSNKYKMKVNALKLLTYMFRILVDSFLAGLLMFCVVYFLAINYLQMFMPLGAAIVIFILNWIVYLITFYSLTIREPFEPAIYQPYDSLRIQHYMRTFYVLCLLLIELIYNFSPNNENIPSQLIIALKIIILL